MDCVSKDPPCNRTEIGCTKKDDAIHIVLASDANYLPGLEVTRASIIKSCSAPERIVWHIFDETSLEHCTVTDMPKWNSSRMPYLRLWLSTLLPDVERVIYSDVDTIWNRDICELWAATAKCATTLAWVRDMASMRAASGAWIEKVAKGERQTFDWSRYGCSGICVMRLDRMRAMGFTQRVLDLYAKYGVPKFPDQDVLNAIFNNDSEMVPSVWGTMGDWRQLPKMGERCVYHLTGVGRHFHDVTPTVYPPQYQMWWNVRLGSRSVHWRSHLLAALWPLHGLARLLPLELRERIVRQWFFAKVLTSGLV